MKTFFYSTLFHLVYLGLLFWFLKTATHEQEIFPIQSKNFIETCDSLHADHYRGLIDFHAKNIGVDPYLIDAIMLVESNYKWNAKSPVGAIGLMQIMPFMVQYYDDHPETVNLYDPRQNIRIGCQIVKTCLKNRSIEHAVAAYNAGEGAVAKYNGIPPYKETEAFVKKVMFFYEPNRNKLRKGEMD